MTTHDSLTKRLEAKEQIHLYLQNCSHKYAGNIDRKSVARLKHLCERTMNTLDFLAACCKNYPESFTEGNTEHGWCLAINAETISRVNTCLASIAGGHLSSTIVPVCDIAEIAVLEISPLTPPVNYNHVHSFMRDVGQSTPNAPTVPSEAVAKLRSKLQVEETLELASGLGVGIELICDDAHDVAIDTAANTMKFRATEQSVIAPTVRDSAGNKLTFSWREVVDGLNDIGVIADGTVIALGLSPYLVQLCRVLVDISNLDKFGEGSYMREDGKWMKQPDWVAPPIAAALALFGIEEESAAS